MRHTLNRYSLKQNVVFPSAIAFLVDAGAEDYCFVENTSVAEFKEKISKLVIYKWNRDYPADFYFDIDYANDYKLETTLDFGGTSHEKITKEVYVR